MSVLAAILDWNNPVPSAEQVAGLLGAALSRSPDGCRFDQVPHAAFGFGSRVVRRAEQGIRQPFRDDLRGICAIGDLRLDNREELRKLLFDGSRSLNSDLEILVAGYERWGDATAGHLVGDFAFVIWDVARREAYAARDPFGVRPLVYRSSPGRLILASTPSQLLALAEVDRTPDSRIVVGYLSWTTPLYGPTFFEAIRSIRPGHFLRASEKGITETEYFHPPRALLQYARDEDYEQQFREIFERSVSDRLDSDYPIVAHLSGGLDSSSIVCMADHLHRENRRTSPAFHVASATFPGQACDEKPFIEQVTRSVGFQSSYWNGNIPSGREFLRPSVDLPGASICFNGGSVGDLEISKAIGARVILSGEAGDFVTGENGLFNELLVQHKWSRILSQILSAESPKDRAGRLRSLRVVMREEASPSVLRIWKGLHPFRASEPAPNWLRGDLGALWGDPEFGRAPRLGIGSSRLQQRSWDYLRWSRLGWSVDFFGCYTADAGVEARYPFLDSRLVSFMLALPVEQRLMAGLRRWLHRRALRDVLPDGISRRSSKPVFNGAVVRWGHASLAPIREMLEGQEWRSGRFVEQREARKLFDSLSSRPQDAADRKGWIHVRAIVNIEAWHRAVFGYARMKETLAMSEIRTISESTRPREEDGRSPSTQPYEAPKLTSVGNVRSFLADGSSSGDDASGGNPLLSALP